MNLKAYSYIIDFKEKHHQQDPGHEFLFLGWLESPEIYQERGLPLLFREPHVDFKASGHGGQTTSKVCQP